MEEKRFERFYKIFPWYSGLSSDLLFYVAIDTLFFMAVKKFSNFQIVFLTTIALFGCIMLQPFIMKIIKKIGNTKSTSLGSLLLLMGSIFITFGWNYGAVAFGRIIASIAFTFINMSNVILENNLELQNRRSEYIKIESKANLVYAIATMLISFVASIMFNFNNYLPMICCILFCTMNFLLSFYIVDYSNYDKVKKEEKIQYKIKYSKLLLLIIFSYGLFYPIANSGQENGKLFIQQELLISFDIEKTALILGGILCISRIIRVISNIAFDKIFSKFKEKVSNILSVLLATSILLMILGSFITSSIALKIVIMSIGYVIILFIRDPFKVYIQDLALKNTKKEEQQEVLTMLELSRNMLRMILSLGFSLILLKYPMIFVMILTLILSCIEIVINIKLYGTILNLKIKQEKRELAIK